MPGDFVLGKDAKAYYGTSGQPLSALTELTNVRDLTLNRGRSEADVTTRGSAWDLIAVVRKNASIDFEMLFKKSDAGFDAIRAAFDDGTELEMAFLTGDKGTSGTKGIQASFSVFQFNESQNLDGVLTVDVTVKPTSGATEVTV